MSYDIKWLAAGGWKCSSDVFTDETGVEISHLEAYLPGPSGEGNKAFIDVYVGEMPQGETAEDQAFANYAETVGFDGDEDDTCPIVKFKFNGKNAWGFDAVTEDDFPMRFISQEVRRGVLAIIVYCVNSKDQFLPVFELIERNLRIK